MSLPKESPFFLPVKINWRIGTKLGNDKSEGIRSLNTK
jgi:hypothetical protein